MTIGSLLLVLALLAGTTAVFATSAVETQAASLLEKALGEKGYPYANNINKASGETARVTTQDYALYLDSTIFTDNHVYAMIRAKGSLPESLNISGRIVYAAHDQTIYALKGESKEIEPDKDGTRYFLYSAIIGESGDAENTDPKVLLAAGDQFLKFNSLRDHAGELLEITINLNGNEHILTTAVANVSTKTLIFHPDAARVAYSKNGMTNIQAGGLYDVAAAKSSEEKPLISVVEALQVMFDEYAELLLDKGTRVASAELVYVSIPAGNVYEMVPAWVFEIAKPSIWEDPESKSELPFDTYSRYVVNAMTGEKLSVEPSSRRAFLPVYAASHWYCS
ncbi:unnamed protein product [Aphanomyces euteiches]